MSHNPRQINLIHKQTRNKILNLQPLKFLLDIVYGVFMVYLNLWSNCNEFIPSFGLWCSYGILGKFFPLLFKCRQNNRQVTPLKHPLLILLGLGIHIALSLSYGARFS